MDLALKLSCSEKQTLFRLKFVPSDIVYITGEVDGLRSAIFISGIIYYKEGVFAPCTELCINCISVSLCIHHWVLSQLNLRKIIFPMKWKFRA